MDTVVRAVFGGTKTREEYEEDAQRAEAEAKHLRFLADLAKLSCELGGIYESVTERTEDAEEDLKKLLEEFTSEAS